MNIIVSHIPLQRPLNPEEVALITRELPPMVSDVTGCHGFYCAQLSGAELVSISVWDSEIDASTATKWLDPWLETTLGQALAGAPQRRVYDVLVAREPGERR
jgi:hypothetical protein